MGVGVVQRKQLQTEFKATHAKRPVSILQEILLDTSSIYVLEFRFTPSLSLIPPLLQVTPPPPTPAPCADGIYGLRRCSTGQQYWNKNFISSGMLFKSTTGVCYRGEGKICSIGGRAHIDGTQVNFGTCPC
jgi:hypothetical protein